MKKSVKSIKRDLKVQYRIILAFCEDDLSILCVNCIIDDKHKSHNIETLSAACSKIMNGILNSRLTSQSQKQSIYSQLKENNEKGLKLKEISKLRHNEISKFYSNLKKLIEKREEELHKRINNEVDNGDKILASSDLNLNQLLIAVNNTLELDKYQFESTLNILKNYQNIQTIINDANKRPLCSDYNPILDSIKFDSEFKQLTTYLKKELLGENSKQKLFKESSKGNGYNTIYVNKKMLKEKIKKPIKNESSKLTKSIRENRKSSIDREIKSKIESMKNSDVIHSQYNSKPNINKKIAEKDINDSKENNKIDEEFFPSFQKRNVIFEKVTNTNSKNNFNDYQCKSEISSIAFKDEFNDTLEKDLSHIKLDFSELCHNPNVYVISIGGYLQNGHNTIEKYNMDMDSWEEYIAAPFNIVKFGSVFIGRNEILIFGGKEEGNRSNKFQIFDVKTKKFSYSEMRLISPKSGFGYSSKGKYIYIIGGNDGISILNSCEFYDFSLKKVYQMKPMNDRRDELASVIGLDGRLFAIGGFGGEKNTCLSSTESFNETNNVWVKLPNLNTKRRALSAVALPDGIYAIGGYDGKNYLNSVEKFDEVKMKWVFVASLNIPRCTFTSFVSPDFRYIYVMGGFNGEPLKSVERFSVINNYWEVMNDMQNTRFMHSTVVMCN